MDIFTKISVIDDAFFFLTGTGLERVEVVGSDLDWYWADPQAVRRRAWDVTAAALIGRF